jgi:hypothetical protein
MATAQRTITVESVLTAIRIDPVAKTLTLRGELRQGTGEDVTVIARFDEDVTDLMDAGDRTAAVRLVSRAQAWIDSKL